MTRPIATLAITTLSSVKATHITACDTSQRQQSCLIAPQHQQRWQVCSDSKMNGTDGWNNCRRKKRASQLLQKRKSCHNCITWFSGIARTAAESQHLLIYHTMFHSISNYMEDQACGGCRYHNLLYYLHSANPLLTKYTLKSNTIRMW